MSCHGPDSRDMTRGAYIYRDAHRGLADGIAAFEPRDAEAALKAAAVLSVQGAALRLVCLENMDLFLAQPEEYRLRVLKPGLPLLAIAGDGAPWPEALGAAARLSPGEDLPRALMAALRAAYTIC